MDGKIYMGKPERRYFYMPWAGNFPEIGTKLVFVNPFTKVESLGTVISHFTEPWLNLSDQFCEDHFSMNAATRRRRLEDNFPQFRGSETVRFIRLKS